ncbi:MAG: ABC transporter ATP-binding protein [Microbacteriaceae bacterium]
MSLVSVTGLSVETAGGRTILDGIDLELDPGRRLGIVGESGSGKSTTASAILGLLPDGVRITSGSIRLGGTELTGLGERALRAVRGKRVSIVYQNALGSLNPVVPVGRQIADVARAHLGLGRREAMERAVRLMAELGIPDARRRALDYPHQFSGGMAQRVSIAMALVCEPELVIADEPTTGLDATIQLQVLQTIDRSIRAAGSALLLISHDLSVVASMTDEVAVMYRGKVIERGTTRAIMSSPAEEYTRGLVAAARPQEAAGPVPRPVDAGAPALRVTGVRKEFRVRGRLGRRVIRPVDDVSFTVPAGSTVALVGESGSGKSTLSRLVVGLHRPDAGSIELGGAPLSALRGSRLRARRHELQMVFQNPLASFDPAHSIGRSVREVLRLDPDAPADPGGRVDELLTAVGLGPAFAPMRPHRVSGGELQRASIARAIAASPALLVLDEPTSALDVTIKGNVIALLRQLQAERGISYLMTTHDLGVVRTISHQVIVLHRGRIVERAATGDIFADARHPYTLRLLRAEQGLVPVPEPAESRDGCPLLGGDCPEAHHEVEVTPAHFVRCWRHDTPTAAA